MELINTIIRSTLTASIPLLMAALGGLFTWHADVFNISMEGMLLASAFGAVVGSYFTGSWFVGILVGIASALIISLLFSFFVFKMRAGEFITGIAINTFVLGLTTYLLRSIFEVKGSLISPKIVGIPVLRIPFIEKIPVIGAILSGHSYLAYFCVLIVLPLSSLLLYRTSYGLRLRASGQDHKVVDSLGINSTKLSNIAILICGILCGLGGSFLSLGFMTMFSENMSNGRGWISLAAIIVTKGKPFNVFWVCLIFGLMEGLGLSLQSYNVPSQITSMLPYLSVLIVLFANSRTKKNQPMKAAVQE